MKEKPVAVAPGLLDEEDAEPSVGERSVGVGAREQHEDLGARGERAPGLRAVDEPSALGPRRARGDVRHVGAEVGLGHGDGAERLATGEARQPQCSLLVGAALAGARAS